MKTTIIIKLLEHKLNQVHTYSEAVAYISKLNDPSSRREVLEVLAQACKFDLDTLDTIVPLFIKRKTIENGINKLLKEQRATNQ